MIVSHEMNPTYLSNIEIIKDYFTNDKDIIEYCGISSNNDFINYEKVIKFKYKIINSKFQLSKVCDFITKHKKELNYDWYIKIRPDVKLLNPICFDNLSSNSINARARIYNGPRKIKFGMSVNGYGPYNNIGDCSYKQIEGNIILDDQVYIFHYNIIELGGFSSFESTDIHEWYNRDGIAYNWEHEWFHNNCWKSRNITTNVVGINMIFSKNQSFSGDI